MQEEGEPAVVNLNLARGQRMESGRIAESTKKIYASKMRTVWVFQHLLVKEH